MEEVGMSENIKPINKRALLSRIRGPKVYVNPRTGEISDKPIKDSEAIPKTTWWYRENSDKEEGSSPLFSTSQVREKLREEALEMAIYFPDFELIEKSDGGVFWTGKIEDMGEVRITYPQTYPAQKFTIELLDLEESFNNELRRVVWSYNGITPAGAIIVAMRLFLLKKVKGE